MTDPELNTWDWKHPETWAHTPPLDEFLAAYQQDDNIWWAIGCGHHQNLFEAACDRIAELEHG